MKFYRLIECHEHNFERNEPRIIVNLNPKNLFKDKYQENHPELECNFSIIGRKSSIMCFNLENLIPNKIFNDKWIVKSRMFRVGRFNLKKDDIIEIIETNNDTCLIHNNYFDKSQLVKKENLFTHCCPI